MNDVTEKIIIDFTELNKPEKFDGVVDKAVYNYYVWKSKNPSPKSYYVPYFDEGLHFLTDLGVEYIPEMIEYIKKNDNCDIVRHAIAIILKAPGLTFHDASPQGKEEWLGRLSKACREAEEIVLNNLKIISDINSSASEVKSARSEIMKIGKLALPYLLKESEKNNPKAQEILSEINNLKSIYSIDIKDMELIDENMFSINTEKESETFDLNSWKASNSGEIKVLETLHELFR